MMVGHAGTVDLAAASFANNVFITGLYFGMGITMGITPLVGKAFGKGNLREVTEWLKNGLVTHFITGMLLTVLMFGVWMFLPWMGQRTEVLEKAKPYYLLLCFSYLPFIIFFSLKQFFEGIGNTRLAMKITLTANAINLILNYVLIFGKLGFPQMGLTGAGIATMISRFVMPVMFIYYISVRPRFRRYFQLAYSRKVIRDKILSIYKIGIPVGFQVIVEVIAFAFGAVMMGWLNEVSLAAHQVAIGLASFSYMIALGISQANTIRVSHQMGMKDYHALKMAAGASRHLVLLFMGSMGLVFILARNTLPFLFTSDVKVVAVAAQLLVIAAVFQLFDGLQVVMLSTLRGMSDVKIPVYMAFFAYFIVGIPTSYLFTFRFNAGPAGIWYGFVTGLAVAGILFYYRFSKIIRNKR